MRNSTSPLRSLHPNSSLIALKLMALEQIATEVIAQSLAPGQMGCLKTRPDGTILDGHHRIFILRKRGVNVDALPREIVLREN